MNNQDQIYFKLIPELCMSLGIHKTIFDENNLRIISHMPVTLYPYYLTKSTYYHLVSLHKVWQKLIVKVSADQQVLMRICKTVSENDQFMKKFSNILQNSRNQSIFKLACTRIDYCGDENPELVQFNLMSVGLNGISDRVQNLTNILKYRTPQQSQFPTSNNQQVISNCLMIALEKSQLQGIVVIIVHEKQFNFGDQNSFKLSMIERGRLVLALTMNDLLTKMKFNQETKQCHYQNYKIAAFYFRTGYKPQHFPTQEHWNLRLRIEQSKTIKLPSVDMIIINTKRMQSQLAKKQIVSKYLEEDQVNSILKVSGEIYDFDDVTEEKLEMIVQRMKEIDFVLKPNREGGGNNFFGKQAYQRILKIKGNREQLKSYIVMKKIEMKKSENHFIFDFQHKHFQETTAQISTFGTFVYRNGEIIANECKGHLVRLKDVQENEGGIAINKAAIAGICLT